MPGRRMNTALIAAAVIVGVYLGIIGLLWRFQERIVFQPPANPESPDAAEVLAYTSKDGIRLKAYVIGSGDPAAPLLVAFHGNAMIARWMIPWAREVSRRFQVTVVLPEYRGYDGIDGAPTYDGSRADAAAALAAVADRFRVRPRDVAYYGHSLGSAVAAELAAAESPRVLLLESPFTSARQMAGRWPIPGLGLVWSAVTRVHYETSARVAALELPVHVAHGERDIIVPARMGRAVHAAARRPGRLLMVPEAGHNDVAIVGGEDYWRWIGEALRQPSR